MKKTVVLFLSFFCVVLFSACSKSYTVTVEDTDFMKFEYVKVYEIDQYDKILNTRVFYTEKSESYKAYPEAKEINVQAICKNGLGVDMPYVNKNFKLHSGANNVHISLKDDNTFVELFGE